MLMFGSELLFVCFCRCDLAAAFVFFVFLLTVRYLMWLPLSSKVRRASSSETVGQHCTFGLNGIAFAKLAAMRTFDRTHAWVACWCSLWFFGAEPWTLVFYCLACVPFLCSIELHAIGICFVRILSGAFSLLTVTVHAAGQCFLASFFCCSYHVLEFLGVIAATRFIGPFFCACFSCWIQVGSS